MQSCKILVEKIVTTIQFLIATIIENNNYTINSVTFDYNQNDYNDIKNFNEYLLNINSSFVLIKIMENLIVYGFLKDYIKLTFESDKIIIEIFAKFIEV